MKKLLILAISVLVLTAFGSFAFILFNNIYQDEGNFDDYRDNAPVVNIDETEQVLKITSDVGELESYVSSYGTCLRWHWRL